MFVTEELTNVSVEGKTRVIDSQIVSASSSKPELKQLHNLEYLKMNYISLEYNAIIAQLLPAINKNVCRKMERVAAHFYRERGVQNPE